MMSTEKLCNNSLHVQTNNFYLLTLYCEKRWIKVKQSEKVLIGACGGYCGGCTDYLAYINNDEKLKRKLDEEFSKQFDMDIKPEDVGCLGCHCSIHKPWCAAVLSDNALKKRGF